MRKKHIRQKTIDSMVNFLNLVKGETLTANQCNQLARDSNMRVNIHNFALQLNYCKRKGKQYEFVNFDFEPIHARNLIKLSNEYNTRVVEEAKLRNQQKQIDMMKMKDAVEITETQNIFEQKQDNVNLKKDSKMAISDYFQNLFGGNKDSNLELKLQEENELLKKNNDDLLFEIKNLQEQISVLELKNSTINNLSNFDEEEIIILREKVEVFEKLFSVYLK